MNLIITLSNFHHAIFFMLVFISYLIPGNITSYLIHNDDVVFKSRAFILIPWRRARDKGHFILQMLLYKDCVLFCFFFFYKITILTKTNYPL